MKLPRATLARLPIPSPGERLFAEQLRQAGISFTREHRVTPELRDYILTRDKGCVGALLDMEGPCDGRIEIDHVLTAGMGKRGPSIPLNLVSLCSGTHHPLKTREARRWRPALIEYLCSVEPVNVS